MRESGAIEQDAVRHRIDGLEIVRVIASNGQLVRHRIDGLETKHYTLAIP